VVTPIGSLSGELFMDKVSWEAPPTGWWGGAGWGDGEGGGREGGRGRGGGRRARKGHTVRGKKVRHPHTHTHTHTHYVAI
jgi:hypothetical protein